MLFNLDFANDNILPCFFFFLITDLHFLIPEVITQIFNHIAELAIPIGIPTKEAEVEMEMHPVIIEIKISAKYNSKLSKLFYVSYSLIQFDWLPIISCLICSFKSRFLSYVFCRHDYVFFRHDYIVSDTLLHK